MKHDVQFAQLEAVTSIGVDWSLRHIEQLGEGLDYLQMMRTVYRQNNQVVDVETTLRRTGLGAEATELMRLHGLVQMGGLPMSPAPGLHVVLCWASRDRRFTTTRDDSRQLRRVMLHFENGVRLRTTGDCEGELSLDGAVVGADAATLWNALTTGKTSLLKRGTGYRIMPNSASCRFRRSLSYLEKTSLELCVSGLSFKQVAAELGCSPPRLSAMLASASAKLGVPSTLDALRLVGGLLCQPERRTLALTSAERDVLSLIKEGLSNQEIAFARQRSPRTVANQVASLLRKTGATGRRALISSAATGPAAKHQ